jgi:transcriptional regulator with XRE-family HTH domain
MTPSIEVARKLAEVFAVTLDYLISDKEAPDTLKDRRMLARWQNLGETIAAAGTLNIDETGWKCKGNRRFLWVFVSPLAVYSWGCIQILSCIRKTTNKPIETG